MCVSECVTKCLPQREALIVQTEWLWVIMVSINLGWVGGPVRFPIHPCLSLFLSLSLSHSFSPSYPEGQHLASTYLSLALFPSLFFTLLPSLSVSLPRPAGLSLTLSYPFPGFHIIHLRPASVATPCITCAFKCLHLQMIYCYSWSLWWHLNMR